MKFSPISLPELYANWMASNWSMLLGSMPAIPAKEPTLKPAPAPAVQEWEDEGGSVKNVKTPRAKPAPKRVRRAGPAKKRRPARKAKVRSRG